MSTASRVDAAADKLRSRIFLIAGHAGAIDQMSSALLETDPGCDICGSWSADESSETSVCYDDCELVRRVGRAHPDVVILGRTVPFWPFRWLTGCSFSWCAGFAVAARPSPLETLVVEHLSAHDIRFWALGNTSR